MPIVRLADCVRQEISRDPKAGKCFRCGQQGHFWTDRILKRYCNNKPLNDTERQRQRKPEEKQRVQQHQQQSESRQRAESFLNRNFARVVAAQQPAGVSDAESKRLSALEAQLNAANNKIRALEQELKEQKAELERQKQQQQRDEQQCRDKAEHLHRHLHILTRGLVKQMLVGTEQFKIIEKEDEKLYGSTDFGEPRIERKELEYPFTDSGLVDLPQLRDYGDPNYATRTRAAMAAG